MGVGMAPVQKTMFDNTLIIGTQVDPALAWGNPVKGFYDPTPNLPVLPSAGDRYISLASANGWFIDYIYEYDGAVWQPTQPMNGLCVFNKDVVSGKAIYYYDITAVTWRHVFSSKNSEYPLLPSKGSPTISDLLAIEDVADGNKKKVITINSLPAATPAAHALAGAQHSADTITNLNTKLSDGDVISTKAGEINALTVKGSPTVSDLLMIEDAADSNNKKQITIASLPAAAPAAHALAGALHSADTITNLNTKLSDGDVISTKAGEIAAIAEKTSLAAGDMFLIEDSADSNNKKRFLASNALGNLKTKGNGVYNPSGITVAVNMIAWRAPYACTVTNVRGYRVGGTGATINARLNGASNHLSSALSVSSADTWMDGGAVQNTVYAAGDKLEVMLVTVTGSPTQILIQVDFKRV
jgi:hypothetical protein